MPRYPVRRRYALGGDAEEQELTQITVLHGGGVGRGAREGYLGVTVGGAAGVPLEGGDAFGVVFRIAVGVVPGQSLADLRTAGDAHRAGAGRRVIRRRIGDGNGKASRRAGVLAVERIDQLHGEVKSARLGRRSA